ncbi:MAG: hypothetical protein Q7R41_00630, partial [Phycisphaerales bacterium]|nr:hypothetical protein [Phycisphaerales bacterium]
MAYRQVPLIAPFMMATYFLGACQNLLRVDVELIQPRRETVRPAPPAQGGQSEATPAASASSTAFSDSSPVTSRGRLRFVGGVLAVRSAVDDVLNRIETVKQALKNTGYEDDEIRGGQFPAINTLEEDMRQLAPGVSAFEARWKLEASITITDMRELRGLQLRADSALTRGMNALGRLETRLSKRLEKIAANDEASRQKAVDTLNAVLSLKEVGANAKAGVLAAGFGGLRSVGVHQINPADPAYRDLLSQARSETVGTFSSVQA